MLTQLLMFRGILKAVPWALALGFVLLPLPAFAYSKTVPNPDQGASETLDVNQDSEQIILPAAPNLDQRPVYSNLPIERDLENLPHMVAKMRSNLMQAARSGDVENLRPIIKRQTNRPVLSFGSIDDPIQYLRDASNDGEGRELLAIMLELLEAPYAVMPEENGEPEIYVWPAYATNDLTNLSPEQLIDVYKIVSHLDLEEMQLFGGWYFFRVGIDANGEWRYFVAGD